MFPLCERGALLRNIMKRLLCGAEQYQTSILINSHFFLPLQDEWAGAAGFWKAAVPHWRRRGEDLARSPELPPHPSLTPFLLLLLLHALTPITGREKDAKTGRTGGGRGEGGDFKGCFFSSDIQCFPNDTNMKSSIYSIYTVYIEESTGAGQNWFLSGCTPCKHVVLTGHAHWHAHSLAHKHTHIHTYFGNIGTLVPLRSSSRLQNIWNMVRTLSSPERNPEQQSLTESMGQIIIIMSPSIDHNIRLMSNYFIQRQVANKLWLWRTCIIVADSWSIHRLHPPLVNPMSLQTKKCDSS